MGAIVIVMFTVPWRYYVYNCGTYTTATQNMRLDTQHFGKASVRSRSRRIHVGYFVVRSLKNTKLRVKVHRSLLALRDYEQYWTTFSSWNPGSDVAACSNHDCLELSGRLF